MSKSNEISKSFWLGIVFAFGTSLWHEGAYTTVSRAWWMVQATAVQATSAQKPISLHFADDSSAAFSPGGATSVRRGRFLFINHLRFFLSPHSPRAWRSRCFFYCTSYVLHCTSRAGGEASFPPLALFCDKDTSRTDKRRNVCYLQVRGKGKKGFWALCTGSGSRTARKHPGKPFVWPGSCSR